MTISFLQLVYCLLSYFFLLNKAQGEDVVNGIRRRFERIDNIEESWVSDEITTDDDNKLETKNRIDNSNYNKSLVTNKRIVDDWNEKYCIHKGCRPLTINDLDFIKSAKDVKEEIKLRNRVIDPIFNLPNHMIPISIGEKSVPYLGLMLDAGKFYYPVEWILNLLKIMNIMGYNLLHLRLTDDYSFNLKLNAIPELANPSIDSGDRVYMEEELRNLVNIAISLNITIMPEINLPVHTGGWAGNHTPNLIVSCARYICNRGSGLPLNLTHPKLHDIVRTVILNVVDIFHTSPFLHLGGDDVHTANFCFHEVNASDYATELVSFEYFLHSVVLSLQKRNVQIIRWEHKFPPSPNDGPQSDARSTFQQEIPRACDIVHYWNSNDYKHFVHQSLVFSSHGLMLDKILNTSAFSFYEAALGTVTMKRSPHAIIVGTRDLGPLQWMDRNVVGRLLAVALGSSGIKYNESKFYEVYHHLCLQSLQFDPKLCSLQGYFTLSQYHYASERQFWNVRRHAALCNTLTKKLRKPVMASRSWARNDVADIAMEIFWDNFGIGRPKFRSIPLTQPLFKSITAQNLDFLWNQEKTSNIQYRGLMLDLSRIDFTGDSLSRILETLDFMNLMQLNVLQLRLMNDFRMALDIPKHNTLNWGTEDSFPAEAIQSIVKHAKALGIQIIPEIATVTRGGGWYGAGVVASCVKFICERGIGVGVIPTDRYFVGIIVSVLYQILHLFDFPPYLHLGFDEREEVRSCYEEASIDVDLDIFERRLRAALQFQDIDETKIIRWENSESILYPNRVGLVTQYTHSMPIISKETFFVSCGLFFGNASDTEMDVWSIYSQTQELVSYGPIGIIAIVDLVHTSFWKDFAILQRLLAFTIGLSTPNLTKEAFTGTMMKAYETFNVKNNLEGKVLDPAATLNTMKQHWEARRKKACHARSRNITLDVPREGWLVEYADEKLFLQ
jgi:Glycosyl hydrolase family 20, catalytic domain